MPGRMMPGTIPEMVLAEADRLCGSENMDPELHKGIVALKSGDYGCARLFFSSVKDRYNRGDILPQGYRDVATAQSFLGVLFMHDLVDGGGSWNRPVAFGLFSASILLLNRLEADNDIQSRYIFAKKMQDLIQH